MGGENDAEPISRTQERFVDRDGAGGANNPAGPGVFIVGAILVLGVVGILLFGPSETVSAVRGLVNPPQTSAQEAPSDDLLNKPPEPTPQVRKHRESPPAEVKPKPAEPEETNMPEPAAEPKRRPRLEDVRVGMGRNQLVEIYGSPAMKTTSSEAGHLVENYTYMSPSQAQQVVVLEDGRVVDTGTN